MVGQLISAGVGIALASLVYLVVASWTRSARGRSPVSVAAERDDRATAPGQLAVQLAELEGRFKAHLRDFEDFEEKVRRWQGRVNRQESRDRQDVQAPHSAESDDERQLSLLATGTMGAPSAPPVAPEAPRRLVPKRFTPVRR